MTTRYQNAATSSRGTGSNSRAAISREVMPYKSSVNGTAVTSEVADTTDTDGPDGEPAGDRHALDAGRRGLAVRIGVVLVGLAGVLVVGALLLRDPGEPTSSPTPRAAVVVPNVVGLPAERASDVIERAGLEVGTSDFIALPDRPEGTDRVGSEGFPGSRPNFVGSG